ncbi:MAG: glycosyltransferase [Acidobacteria bacterium]|nr:glycosyltransferase [Acidobacteriota bacterium]
MGDRIASKISVLLPCFNEGLAIRENVAEISLFFSVFADAYEIVCVDDGSRDNTLDELQAIAARDPHVKVLHYAQNQGKGFALRHGFQEADGDYIVFLDADLDLHPRLLGRFFDMLGKDEADVVIGSKRHPDSRISYPRRRKLISKIYHYILWLLFGLPLRDTQVGLKVFKRAVLDEVFHKIICRRFAFDVELLANIHRLGYKIAEAPIELEFRRHVRWGRVTWSTLWSTLLDTLAIFYRMYILKYYDLTLLKPGSYPRVSVIVPYDRYSADLDDTLRSCLELRHENFQVVAAGPVPPEMVSERIRHIRLDARSGSLLEVVEDLHGEILAFLRPGVVPDPLWLQKALKNFGSAQIVAVSGPVLPTASGDFWSEAVQKVLSSLIGCGGFRYRYVQSLHRYINTVTMSNLIIRRADLVSALKKNRFEAGVEIWLGQYIQQAKRRIVYDPEAVVYSKIAPLFLPYLFTIFEWGQKRGRYVRQNPASVVQWPGTVFILPSLLVLFLTAGISVSFFSPYFAKAFVALLAVYLLLVTLESFASLRPKMVLAIFGGIVATHLAYGAGCLVALLSYRKSVKPVAIEVKQ